MKEYIIERADKKIKIVVKIVAGYCSSNIVDYRITDILILPKGKRKWLSVSSSIRDDYSYRRLDTDGRREFIKNKFLSYVSIEEIEKAVQIAYDGIKPQTDKFDYWCY